MKIVAQILNNKVINLITVQDDFIINTLDAGELRHEYYNSEIHPWGPAGKIDTEISSDWKKNLKEQLGYCIFCGDMFTTGSVTI